MKSKELENKIRRDTKKVKKDLTAFVKDGRTQIGRIENDLNQSRGGITTWVEDGISNLGDGIGKLTGNVRETLMDTTSMLTKEVGHGLKRYNAKAQDIANKVPGSFAKKASRYPWVTITITLVLGLLIGGLLKPARQPLG